MQHKRNQSCVIGGPESSCSPVFTGGRSTGVLSGGGNEGETGVETGSDIKQGKTIP